MRVQARHGAKGRQSFLLFLAIVGFSVGLLGGYLFLGSPAPDKHASRRITLNTGQLWGRKELAGSGKAALAGATTTGITQTRELVLQTSSPSSALVSTGITHASALGQAPLDEQLKKQMMQQNSVRDEHLSAEKSLMKQQLGDVSDSSSMGSAKKSADQQRSAALSGGGQAATQSPAASASASPSGLGPGQVLGKFPGTSIHTLFTSNGSPYQNFQARVMVGTWNIVRKQPGGEHMVALTRILHRTTPDEVMNEIPTFIAKPLQPECDKWCWFPVADRANAVQQFINAAEKDPSLVKGAWLLMLETDYVWMKPLPAPGDAYDPRVPGLSFAYDYIGPRHPVAQKLLKEKCPTCSPDSIPNSGPAPVLMRFGDLKAATPIWEELSLWIEQHKDAKEQLGWVREMYAWDIGVAAHKLNILNQGHPSTPLIAQPPHDTQRFNASMYHYTWGAIFHEGTSTGKEVWKFDKRFITAADDALKIPKMELPPAFRPGVVMQDGMPVTQELRDTMEDMLAQMNKAADMLPDLRPQAQAAKTSH